MGEPNVLMLDEPTNDLDIDTLAAIEDTLDSWPGTLVVVSHDRYLLERVTDHQLALLGDGGLRDLPGGVEQYLELRAAAQAADSAPSAGGRGPAAAAGGPAAPAAAQRLARKEMTRIERQLSRLAGQEETLHARMAEQAGDHTALMALDVTLRAVHAERAGLEEEWLTVAELAD
jgi:ABC-type multidrug transport system ATPase subunit